MSDYNSSSPQADWSECTRCKLCTNRRRVVLRRSGLVQLGAICHIEIDTLPFDHAQRRHTFNGLIALDRKDKIKWLLPPNLSFFALRDLCPTIPHILILGEGPGEAEDNTGKPFWGPAGMILDNVLHATKSTFYFTMTNTVCCRPTKIELVNDVPVYRNRQPTPEEQEACKPHTRELLDSYDFAGILCLGEIAAKYRQRHFYKHNNLNLNHPSWILRQSYRHLLCVKQALRIDDWIKELQ